MTTSHRPGTVHTRTSRPRPEPWAPAAITGHRPDRDRRSGRDRGSVAVEITLFAPLLVVLLLFTVACGRIAHTRLRLEDAAHQGARAASLARDPTDARRAASTTVTAALAPGGTSCTRLDVSTDTSRYHPGGTVTITVTCTTDLSDLTALHLPGVRAQSVSFTSPLDTFRATTGGTP